MTLFARVRRFLRRQEGAIISTEMVLWAAILVVGLIVGVVAVRFAVTTLYLDTAEALANRAGYTFGTDPRAMGTSTLTTGTFFVDNAPFPGTDSGGIQTAPATGEKGN